MLRDYRFDGKRQDRHSWLPKKTSNRIMATSFVLLVAGIVQNDNGKRLKKMDI